MLGRVHPAALKRAFVTNGRPKAGLVFACAAVLAFAIAGAINLLGDAGGLSAHLLYLPVLLAAMAFELPGAIVMAVVASLAIGPVFMLDAHAGQDQGWVAWLAHSSVLLAVGAMGGALANLYRRRSAQAEARAARYSIMCNRVLTSLANVVENRDRHAEGHCERVAQNALAIGNALDFGEQELETLYWGALLHDLGKITVSDQVLFKPAALTEEEYLGVKQHPDYGSELLESMSSEFADIAQVVRFHHERWDGRGYPLGLRGETIPLMSRIVAVVDVFEALTSERPYRQPIGATQALAYLRSESGTHFDPRLVALFEELHAEGRIRRADEYSYAPDWSSRSASNVSMAELNRN